MAKPLNFNTHKKNYWSVTLPGEKPLTLLIGTPTKTVLSRLTEAQNYLSTDVDQIDESDVDNLYEIVAVLLSRNKGGVKITKEYVEDIFDFEDIILFITNYIDFVSEIANSKN